MVCDVGLGDTVGHGGTDPAHDGAGDTGATHQVTIHGGKSATGESEGRGTVVGKERVGVLEEGDHDEPAERGSRVSNDVGYNDISNVLVNPEVGDKVVREHRVPAKVVDPVIHGAKPQNNTDIRDDDLEELGGLEQVASEGVEV